MGVFERVAKKPSECRKIEHKEKEKDVEKKL
jgi:hypothetical protein